MDEKGQANLCAIREALHLCPLHKFALDHLESGAHRLGGVALLLVCLRDMLRHLFLDVRSAFVALASRGSTTVSQYKDLPQLRHHIASREGILVPNSHWQGLTVALECILRNVEEVAPLLLQLLLSLLRERRRLLLLLDLDRSAVGISHVLGPRLAPVLAAQEGDLLVLLEHAESRRDDLGLVHKELFLICVVDKPEALALVVHLHGADLTPPGLLLLVYHLVDSCCSLELSFQCRVHGHGGRSGNCRKPGLGPPLRNRAREGAPVARPRRALGGSSHRTP
mmetsp:Transcript_65826/g.140841  ORF Transcript_65826/g.140841 Transcript_65826/m.140841 type:complete len:281 (+) Transcript_65826:682-1524(+)